ncbi:hypothetical protein J18TS1_35880 [Oceanobacillus oncorhynchi subsp. incaldanensis]|uniref:DUF2812 domain-containing protein n=2 Tax=Oceanobacillus TaxID=182709 RepID=A0A0A1MSV5_9BACI|nr:DUF2812 domain-containing protein [Oceanobacillus oncorhynchi]MDM8101676.1 DUF2812 domain-containing protein [Oceanobacillus oncorhynchi]UUI41327.1 DUF2812 domain-containing protein [Oceanobacillus oncorhynchi]GIO20488.1 hypothetical protein J18TS1_35880 [Oceanobacillus oncorhynchi subsp. incaldanensis]CEI82744.1 hypothetical protein BN997_02630 [Oceanobacillus oncorhynchi]
MEKKVKKLFTVWKFAEEEQWLNEMASDGWELVKVSVPNYRFIKSTPNKYIYRLELLDPKLTKKERKDYIDFMEETGAEKIGEFSNWIYFRKNAELGEFNIFSDLDSRIVHLKRMFQRLLAGFISIITILIFSTVLMINNSTPYILSMITTVIFVLILCLFLYGLIQINKRKKELAEERQFRE